MNNRNVNRRPLKIIVVDDDKGARKWIPMVLKGSASRPGPLAGEDVVTYDSELTNTDDYENYDGVVLDWMLVGITGPEVADQINKMNWKRPVILLLTSLNKRDIPMSVYQNVHYVLSKDDIINETTEFFWTLRRFAKHMSMIRAAYEDGRDSKKDCNTCANYKSY